MAAQKTTTFDSDLGLAQFLQDVSLSLGARRQQPNDVASGEEKPLGWLENVQEKTRPKWWLNLYQHHFQKMFSPWNMVMFSSSPQKEVIESILGKPPTLHQWSSWRLVLAPHKL